MLPLVANISKECEVGSSAGFVQLLGKRGENAHVRFGFTATQILMVCNMQTCTQTQTSHMKLKKENQNESHERDSAYSSKHCVLRSYNSVVHPFPAWLTTVWTVNSEGGVPWLLQVG